MSPCIIFLIFASFLEGKIRVYVLATQLSMTLFYPFRGTKGSPLGTDVKENVCNVGDPSLIPGSGRSSGGGHGNPLQYSCLENSMDRGAWWSTVHGSQRVRQCRETDIFTFRGTRPRNTEFEAGSIKAK